MRAQEFITEGAGQKPIIIYTNNRGATIDDDIKKSLPVTQISFDKLHMWESHKSMKDPKVADWVNNKLLPELQQNGILKPLLVWNNNGEFFVIDGNHRFIAYQEAGYQGRVPVQIVPDNMITVSDTVPGQQGMAENKAAGIDKMFNNLGDPVYANLQRVALLAMQGRQSEAAGRLQTVIKHADPAVQTKITDAVNNIKPVTINGRVADSSTLDKSKQHNDWITNTFIPWVQSLLGHQDVTEAKTVEFEGLTLKVIKQGHELTVDALDDWGNKVLGHVKFNIGDGKELDPQDLRVDDKYQGQGIARVMYDYVKSLGYTINRSWDQTDAGAGFWNKHRGEDVRVWEQGVAEGKLVESAVFLNPNTVVVGQAHGQPLELSPDTLKKIQAIAAKHGAYYEGNGTDRSYTKGQIDRYVGSWDDEVAKTASPNDPKWLYVLFANVDENNRVQRVGVDPKDTIFNRLLAGAQDNSFQGIGYTAQALQKFLQMASEGKYDFVKMSQQPATQENLTRFLKAGEALMWPSNWEQYPNRAGKIAKAATVDVRDQYLATRKAGVYVTGSGHLKAVQNITGKQDVAENFADGKNPGRKGLAKRSGVNTKASVSDLRKTAKNSSGEKQRMAHWLANMKAGRAKAKRK